MKVTKDLRPNFGPIRDQGERPTCLPFATSDAHAAVRDGWEALSPEYLFFQARRRSPKGPENGCSVPEILDALRVDGQPKEQDCPYQTKLPDSSWCPSAKGGKLFRRLGEPYSQGFAEVILKLEQEHPVVLLLNLSIDFFSSSGIEPIDFDSSSPPNPAMRHAVVAVAHGHSESCRGVLIRNSWGAAWADKGHAWLSERFVQTSMFGYIVLGGEPNGDGDSVAA